MPRIEQLLCGRADIFARDARNFGRQIEELAIVAVHHLEFAQEMRLAIDGGELLEQRHVREVARAGELGFAHALLHESREFGVDRRFDDRRVAALRQRGEHPEETRIEAFLQIDIDIHRELLLLDERAVQPRSVALREDRRQDPERGTARVVRLRRLVRELQQRRLRAALDGDADRLVRYWQKRMESAAQGERNDTLNKAAYSLGELVRAGVIRKHDVYNILEPAAMRAGLGKGEATGTIASGLRAWV